MQRHFAKLKQALQDPADGPYALVKMRELLLDALQEWPTERYGVVDYLLPHGRPIRKGARNTIWGLLGLMAGTEPNTVSDILKMTKMCELLTN